MSPRMRLMMLVVMCVCLGGLCLAESDSRSDTRLQKLLKRFPQADANGDGVLTLSEAKAYQDQQRRSRRDAKDPEAQQVARPTPTFADVPYGPHERNVLDFYQAESDKPAPLVVYIHGGGFVGGDKRGVNPGLIRTCHEAGVSVGAIHYRFRKHAPIQDILRDAARAIQFFRYKAKDWNLDKTRIVSYGGSAGAGTSLWLAFHDDLARPDHRDPVLRESSRISAAGSLNGQFSYDVLRWEEVLGAYPGPDNATRDEVFRFYWFENADQMQSPQGKAIRADVDMLGLLSRDDPPIFLHTVGPNTDPKDHGHYVHHPRHSIVIKQEADRLGVECLMLLKADDPELTAPVVQEKMLDFFFKYLKVERP